jgi:uncharacterized protein
LEYQRFGDRYQVRLESGDRVIESLTRLAQQERIGFAALSGLGAVRWVRLAFFDVETRQYENHDIEEQLEVTALVGNVTLRDGRSFIHAHATLGRRDLSTLGGHLMEAVAHSTLEVWLQREAAEVHRLPDDESGLALMRLADRLERG